MPTVCRTCHDCETKFGGLSQGFCCQSCSRWFCESCVSCTESRAVDIDAEEKEDECKKLCRACGGKVYKRSNSGGKCYDSPFIATENLASSLETQDFKNTASICSSNEEEEARNVLVQFLFPSDVYVSSDIELGRVSGRDELFRGGSSPQDSPRRNSFSPLGNFVQHTREERPNVSSFEQERMVDQEEALYLENHEVLPSQEDKSQQPLDFENNSHVWYPPPAKDDVESLYDEEDSDIGHSASKFFSHNPAREQSLRTVANDRFRGLMAESLHGFNTHWLDIVTSLAWKAANFIRPDTSIGSMDPRVYVKIKCVASGNPNQSIFIKGIVCSKNINHKRMNSQYQNPRLLLLAESLEHQRVAGQLESLDKLLQQEKDHLKMIKAQIESQRPNVVLVEKSVSSHVQQYLLEKKISLVLNMKRPLLERIARCTGALLCLWGDGISTAQVGHCELFRTEKVKEQQEAGSQPKRKASKTLMYFEGCPRRLGCTVLLRGCCREELKKVKQVVQYAVFAAYNLSLETSFLRDEGASLPIVPSSSGMISCDLKEDLPNKFATRLNEDVSSEHFSVADQSILVFFSSRCVPGKKLCERSRPLRIRFSGPYDKPLGTYLKDDLFTQTSSCGFCKELVDAHIHYYTHQNENLAIYVKLLSLMKLPGEEDGNIWMWHRCLRCAHVDGVPPASPRVVMSDAASRLSFGKFLELSFSNHANRVASCGHSLQRDCLRFFGYSPMDIHTVYLPPSVLEFCSASHMAVEDQVGLVDSVIPVYEDDPGSAVSYALSSKEYKDWVASRSDSMGSVDVGNIHQAVHGSKDDKKSPHFTISFNDALSAAERKMKFHVICYYATQFDTLRKNCCPSEMDFVRSLSRCKMWHAQGGKSKVYFAKSLDERFIIKEVVNTELESFERFAQGYFKYFVESFSSRTPTCMAKILGIYQASVKHLRGGKQMKKDFMVMENLFYNRNISRVYDLKGSMRSRYNVDTSGANKVLLDMNLLEAEAIFIGSKAKRGLERAIWNDTSFLSSADVMDYSLLVGMDEERKELVLGIIDYLRKYTWDKQFETMVKASGFLGGPINVLPTIIPPKPYKKRFREAMTSYFVTVPDQLMS